MNPTTKLIALSLLIGGFTLACNDKSEVDQKKEELKEYQAELKELKVAISDLEKEISELDSTFGKKEIKKTLITTFAVKKQYFEHKVEMRGSVESRKNVTIGSEVPGKVERIFVKEGQLVKRGQTLVTLDASVIKNNIAELETSLELAGTIYERQSNLWKKKIGTEIQYLQAKNNYESIEKRLATANSQLDQAIIRAPFSGSIDEIVAKEGEITQPGMPMIRIVNPNDVYIKSDISERFIGVFETGDEVEIYFPVQDKQMVSKITSVGQVINSQNRTFEVEIEVPRGLDHTRPNQVVVLKLSDYVNEQAIVVPSLIIQKDSRGSYLYTIEQNDDKSIAKKTHISAGISYQDKTEILGGIKIGQTIAHKGYRDLSDGAFVEISTEQAEDNTMVSVNNN